MWGQATVSVLFRFFGQTKRLSLFLFRTGFIISNNEKENPLISVIGIILLPPSLFTDALFGEHDDGY